MGQRHQAFLIAKVKPHGSTEAKYRCVAAYHHQWCYGTLPLRAARRLLTLVKQPENAEIIREELRGLDGKYGRFREKPKIPDVPCPFIATILGSSWDADLTREHAYFSGASLENNLLEASMGSWEGDNNDGITVIDITNPDDPAYCFHSGTTPLSAEDYVRGYYNIKKIRQEHGSVPSDVASGESVDAEPPIADSTAGVLGAGDDDPELTEDAGAEFADGSQDGGDGTDSAGPTAFEKGILQAIDDLEGERLLLHAALSEAWPSEYKTNGPAASAPAGGEANVPSLVDISFRQTIEHSLAASDVDGLDELPMFLEKMNIVEEILLQYSPVPDSALPLLSKVLERKSSVYSLDLSGYSLSDSQIIAVAADVVKLRAINLSRNPLVTVSGLRSLLAEFPSLRRLVLLNCPVSNAELMDLISREPTLFRNLDAIIHPVFMNLGNNPEDARFSLIPEPLDNRIPIGITIFSRTMMYPPLQGVSLPFVNLPFIVQGFTDAVKAKLGASSPFSFEMTLGRILEVAFSASPREPSKPWGERSITMPLPLNLEILRGSREGWVLTVSRSETRTGMNYAFARFRKSPDPPAGDDSEQKGVTGVATNLLAKVESLTGRPEYPKVISNGGNGQPPFELHDLSSFLEATEQEGYLAASEDQVKMLKSLMRKARFKVMNEEDACSVFR